MITKIKNRILYKKKVKFLKTYAVNITTNFILKNNDFINGFQKLLIGLNDTETKEELIETVSDFLKGMETKIKEGK